MTRKGLEGGLSVASFLPREVQAPTGDLRLSEPALPFHQTQISFCLSFKYSLFLHKTTILILEPSHLKRGAPLLELDNGPIFPFRLGGRGKQGRMFSGLP